MGIFFSNINEHFIFERVIDGENLIYIGVLNGKKTNMLSTQGIRFGNNGKIKRLLKFNENKDSLNYEFEEDTSLSLIKRNNNFIIINYKDCISEINIIKPMESIIKDFYKPINFGSSYEFDKICDFIKT